MVGYHCAAFHGTHGTHASELQVSFRKRAIYCKAPSQKVIYSSMFVGHFLQKSCTINGGFAKRDLQQSDKYVRDNQVIPTETPALRSGEFPQKSY